MTNNKILNMRRVAVALLLLWAGAANGEDELKGAMGFQLGGHGFTNINYLCSGASLCTYERTAWTGAPYLRLKLSPHHSVLASYRVAGSQGVTPERFRSIQNLDGTTSFLLVQESASFYVKTTSLAYEYRHPLGMPDLGAFLKIGYHSSKLEQANDSDSFGGILLGGGFVLNDLLIAGYEYFDAGDLEHGHYLYLGVEFGL